MSSAESARSNQRMSRRFFDALSEDLGSQLLELALSLPFLLIIVIGIIDFGQAYNTKHILTNAAREAARMTVSSPTTDFGCKSSIPCPIQAAADTVQVYLVNAGLTKAVNGKTCSLASTGTGTDPWTFSCNGVSLTINRAFVVSGGAGGPIPSTQVSLSYSYSWTLGKLIGLLRNGSALSLPSSISTTVVMQNLTSG